MDFKDLDKKTAEAVLDEVIRAINTKEPAVGETDYLVWYNAYTDIREKCYQLKMEIGCSK